jgi:hypothetical protein
MSDLIGNIEKTCASVRKLNFPVYKLELAAAAEITDLNNNKETLSFSCRKKMLSTRINLSFWRNP